MIHVGWIVVLVNSQIFTNYTSVPMSYCYSELGVSSLLVVMTVASTYLLRDGQAELTLVAI